jgi:hypothetical protein
MKNKTFLRENLKGRYRLGDQGIGWRVILKQILKRWHVWVWNVFCECGNELWGCCIRQGIS